MQTWREEQLHKLDSAKDQNSLYQQALDLCTGLGFEYCAFGMRSHFPLNNPKLVLINNYSVNWQQRYAQQNYLAIDPTVAHCHRSLLPIVWSDKVFAKVPEFWEEARAVGLCHGWGQSAKDYRGIESMLSLARSHDIVTRTEFLEKAGQILWLGNLIHSLMANLLFSEAKLVPISLSLREVEVLKWSAEGKTAIDISVILGLSERTINFHINNSIRKMGVVNKTSAVVKAAVNGLL